MPELARVRAGAYGVAVLAGVEAGVVAAGADDVVVVGVGDVVVVGVGDVVAVAVAVGDVDAYVAEYVLTGWVTPAFDDALVDGFGWFALLAVLVTDETWAAGDWAGGVVCPCELRAKAAPAPP